MWAISCAIRSKIKIILRTPKMRFVTGDVDLRVIASHARDSKNIATPTASLNG